MATVKIKGMRCQHCVDSTQQALEKIARISDVKVDLEKGEATYQGDVDVRIVKEAILKIGFEYSFCFQVCKYADDFTSIFIPFFNSKS